MLGNVHMAWISRCVPGPEWSREIAVFYEGHDAFIGYAAVHEPTAVQGADVVIIASIRHLLVSETQVEIEYSSCGGSAVDLVEVGLGQGFGVVGQGVVPDAAGGGIPVKALHHGAFLGAAQGSYGCRERDGKTERYQQAPR